MPRGKRKTYSEKLEEVRAAIEGTEKQLRELKNREKELLREKREDELNQIAELLEERNLTPGQLAQVLDQVDAAECRAESA